MAVEDGFIQYTVDVKGADQVRREFDELADAAIKTGKGFEQLDKHLAENEKRHGRVVARLRESVKALREYAAMTRKAEGSNATKSIDERRAAYERERRQVDLLGEELEKLAKRRKLDTELEGNIGQANRATDRQENQGVASTLGREEAARQRLTKALREQADAKARLDAVGDPRRGTMDPARYQEANTALRGYTNATNEATAAQRNMDAVMEETNRGIISQRYALYDVSNMLTIIGGAMSGVGIYAAVTGAQFETAFTNVERTLESGLAVDEIANIRNELVMLQGQIPLTFDEITTIAQLGNQLGIAADEVTNFTRVVAQFSSLTGISTEEATLAFGQLGNLLGVTSEHYENLASSIVLVGINSAATEAQIISIAREIAPAARAAGLAADEVIGLSGALASIRVPPERSRSTILQFFEKLNTAAAEGGQQMEDFATVVGTSADELATRLSAGQGMGILEDFLGTLSEEDTIGVTQALDALGLAGLRVNPTMRALSDNMDLLNQTMRDGHQGFIQGSELQERYALTLDDLNSQWVIFINGLNSLVDAISSGAIPGLSGMLQLVNQLVFGMVEFLQRNPWAKYILGIGAALTAVTGIMIVWRAIVMRGQAALLAFATAAGITTRVNIGTMGSLRGLIGGFLGVQRAAHAATGATLTFSRVLSRTLWGAAIVGAGWLVGELFNLGGAAEDASMSMDQYNAMNEAARRSAEQAAGGASDLGNALGGGGGGGGAPSVADAAEEAAEKLRLLTDYADDLSGVLSRSFDIRFGPTAAMDSVISRWNKLREEAEKYQQEINKLTADRSLREYWLSVAEMYNDQLRAGQLRAEIADIDDDLAKANAGASTELRGNTQAAVDNRATMRGLLQDYQAYLEALASSGASQAFIQQETSRLNQEFQNQAAALGFSADELSTYAVAFDDMATIVAGVPRDVTLDFNGDPALQALAEFRAKLEDQARQAGNAAGQEAAGGFGDGLGAGLDGLGGLDGGGIPIGADQFIDDDSWKASGRQGGRDWVDSMWLQIQNFGEDFTKWWTDMSLIISDIIEPFAFLFGVDDDEFSKWQEDLRFKYGRAGTLGSAAYDASFSKGLKTGEVLINGITYQWDEVANTYHRLGATSAEEMDAGFRQISPTEGVLGDVTYHRDAITGEWFTTGSESGVNYNEGLSSFVDPADVIREKITLGRATSNSEMALLAESMGYTFDKDYSASTDPIGVILGKLQAGEALTNSEASTLANSDASSYNSKFGSTADPGGKISQEFRGSQSSTNTAARNSGSSAGRTWWDEFVSFWNFEWLFGQASAQGSAAGSASQRRRGGGRSHGGYTGAGYWKTPAGIVHKGEYVVPKKHVDQRLGLPRVEYVESLRRGKPAPRGNGGSAGYASGGHVGGAGAIELGEYTLNRIGRQVAVSLRVDRQELATAASGGDARLARRGSN